MAVDTRTYTIGELAQAGGVTRRTIRYYVAQELLPPPQGSGRASRYGEAHLQRLKLITLLKQEFLPLNEIKALLEGLDDEAVAELSERRHSPPPRPETARQHMHALLSPEPSPESPASLRRTVAYKLQGLTRPAAFAAHAQPPAALPQSKREAQRLSTFQEIPTPANVRQEVEGENIWQRYSLHPDVELHVRQPPSDPQLRARLDRLITEIRRLIVNRDPRNSSEV